MQLNLKVWLCEQLKTSDSTAMKVHAESVMFLLVLQFCLLSVKRNVGAAEASRSGVVLLGRTSEPPSAKPSSSLLKGAGWVPGRRTAPGFLDNPLLSLGGGTQLGDGRVRC